MSDSDHASAHEDGQDIEAGDVEVIAAVEIDAPPPPPQPSLIAVLDGRDRLVGTRRAFPIDSDVVLPERCDLPMDGTYKWVEREKAFFPLGHGFQRPATRPNISEARVLYLICSQMRDSLPAEAAEWMQWYEENVKARDEEATLMRRIRRGR